MISVHHPTTRCFDHAIVRYIALDGMQIDPFLVQSLRPHQRFSEFIFMYGQVAHPPAVEHPSPQTLSGTIPKSSSSATASRATGKMMSTAISDLPCFCKFLNLADNRCHHACFCSQNKRKCNRIRLAQGQFPYGAQ